jgi:hypothetical protein
VTGAARGVVAAWLACGAASLGLPAGAEIVEFNLARPFEHRVSIATGEFVELCGTLLRGQVVDWRFNADAPLDFNIHHHEGGQVITPQRRDAARRGSGRLVADADRSICWMWSNRADAPPVVLRARLRAVRRSLP